MQCIDYRTSNPMISMLRIRSPCWNECLYVLGAVLETSYLLSGARTANVTLKHSFCLFYILSLGFLKLFGFQPFRSWPTHDAVIFFNFQYFFLAFCGPGIALRLQPSQTVSGFDGYAAEFSKFRSLLKVRADLGRVRNETRNHNPE